MASNQSLNSGMKASIILLLLLISKTKLQDINKIVATCKVHNDVIVDIDPGQHRYYPYLVKLPRCAGSVAVSSPNVKKCAPTAYNRIPYTVYAMPSFRSVTVNLDHHTSCNGKCVKSSSSCNSFETWDGSKCQCDCRYIDAPSPSPCKHPLIWRQSKCNCECQSEEEKCSDEKEWNSELCTCTCKKRYLNRCIRKNKLVNQETCKCLDIPAPNATASARGSIMQQDCVKSTTVIMIAVLEFLLLTIIFALIYCHCSQSHPCASSFRSNSGTKWPWDGMNCQGYNGSCKGPQMQEQRFPMEQQNGSVSLGNQYDQSYFADDQENSGYIKQNDAEENVHSTEGHNDLVLLSSDHMNGSLDSKVTAV